MRGITVVLIALATTFAAYAADGAELTNVPCKANDHRQVNATGQLVVTEYAFAFTESDCPTTRLQPGTPFLVSRKVPLYFWARLQGDSAYLRSSQSRRLLVASFYLLVGDTWTYQKSIGMKYIDRPSARAEATADDTFDWRVRASKWSFDVPGEYRLQVQQGGEEVCLAGGLFQGCAITFSVE